MIARSLPYGLKVAVLVLLYVAAAKLGLLANAVGGSAATGVPRAAWISPPTAISLVALLLFGRRLWPGITLGAWLFHASDGLPWPTAAGIALGSTLEALVAASLLRSVVAFRPSMERLRDVIGLVILAACLSTAICATVGVTSAWLGGMIPTAGFSKAWWTWWLRNMAADLVLVPLLLVWSSRPRLVLSPGRAAEAVVLLAALTALSLLVFGDLLTRIPARVVGGGANHPYILFPLLIWAALRFGRHGAVTTVFVVLVAAICGTGWGMGPFARNEVSESLFLLQSYMSVAAVTTLVLAADVTERRRVEAALREARDGLEIRVQERTAELCRANAELAAEMDTREKMQERIWASRRELREYIDNMSTFNAKLDTEGRFLLVNRTTQLASGLSFQELLKANFLEGSWWSFDPEVQARVRAAFCQAVAGTPINYDERLQVAGDRVLTINFSLIPIFDEERQVAYLLAEGRDISTLKQTEAELRRTRDELDRRVQERTAALARANEALQVEIAGRERLEEELRQRAEDLARADRAKDQFLAMLAHELRNPLAAIAYAVQLLRRSAAPNLQPGGQGGRDSGSLPLPPCPPSSPPLGQACAVIERQVGHQTRLLDDLLNVSRIARGKISLHPIRLDVGNLVRDTVEDHRRSLEAAGLSLALEMPHVPGTRSQGGYWVEGDPTRLAQVLSNLLQNAGKFTDPGGRVEVTLGMTSDGDRVVVTVKDTGIGIEAEMLPRIFDCFTQSDRSLSRSRGGLGLGLALVKGLLELHGGTVQAESDGLGRGSTFTFWLPLASASEAEEKIGPDENERIPSCRVLVVDDNQDAAESLCELLALLGHEVAVAYTGPEGVATAQAFQPEVVLCDLGLPGMDGYAVAEKLSRDGEGKRARLIAISGYGQEEDRHRSRRAGFEEHLTKPVNLADLERLLAAGTVDPLDITRGGVRGR